MKCLLAVSTILSAAAATATATAALSSVGGPDSPINVTPQNYTDVEGTFLQGFLSLPDNNHSAADEEGGNAAKVSPAVIVLHDQDGPNTYEQQRATIFASQYGYVGFAADIYGVDTELPAEDASFFERMPFLAQFSGNSTLFVQRIQAAIDYVQALDEVDETKVAIVGYCMGGIGVVHYLNHHNELGLEDGMRIKGAIAIHPSLTTDGSGPTGPVSVPSLFLTGGNDFLTGPDAMEKLESDMKWGSVDTKTKWESVRYAKIEHAFSNWFSTGYDARADARSFHSILSFLEEAFGRTDYDTQSPSTAATGPEANVLAVDYSDGIHKWKGYVSMPEDLDEGSDKLLPVVILLPHKMDDTGADEYESQRATQITADTGFITFVAHVYSQDTEDMSLGKFEDMYHANHTKYQTRIQAAVNHAKTMDHIDPTKIAVIGFGFGGSGALYYGLWEDMDGAVKAVASFHGEMDKIANSIAHLAVTAAQPEGAASWGNASKASWGIGSSEQGVDASAWSDGSTEGGASASGVAGDVEGSKHGSNKPQILIQSGAEEDDMSHVIIVEKVLIRMGANYELTRFSDAKDKFTIWNDGQDQYDARATARSMDQLYTVLEEVFDTKLSPATPKDDGLPDFQDEVSSVAATSSGFAFIASAIMGILILQL